MTVDRIYIENFGMLSEFEMIPGQGLNVLYAPNESGKSTLLAFIKFMFYGSKQKKDKGGLLFKERFMPWSGMPMSGSIEFTHNGKKYVIYRKEGSKNGSKVFEIKNPVTGENYRGIDDPGKYFFSVGEKAFSESCFVTEASSITDADGDIISVLTGNDTESLSYTKVNKALEEKLLNLTSTKRASSAVSKLVAGRNAIETELLACEREQKELESKVASVEVATRKLEESTCELDELLKQKDVFEKSKDRIRLKELKRMRDEESENLGILVEKHDEITSGCRGEYTLSEEEREIFMKDTSEYESGVKTSLIQTIIFGLLTLVFLLASVVAFWGTIRSTILWASLPLTVVSALLFGRSFSTYRHRFIERTAFLERKQEICLLTGSASYTEYLENHSRTYRMGEMQRTLYSQIQQSKNRLEDINSEISRLENIISDIVPEDNANIFDTNSFTNEDLDVIIKDKEKSIDDIKSMIMRMSFEVSRLDEVKKRIRELRLELDALNSREKDIESRQDVILAAREILDNAFSKLRDNFAPALSKKAFDIFSQVAQNECGAIVTNEKFEAAVKLGNEYKDVRTLSEGTRELIYLSLRIAETDFLSDGDCVPVFFDDVLASFDDRRCERMLTFLDRLSSQRQIFLCTCRGREVDWCVRNTDANIIEFGKDDTNG